ncbi:MAG: hypothetical protein AAGD88_07950 [Bacteroidota bacterium]
MKKDLWLGIGILVLSILNIVIKAIFKPDLSLVVSLIGILSFVLQVLKKDIHKTLQTIWILAQIPMIMVLEPVGNVIQQMDILNLTQFFNFKLQLRLTYSPKTYAIGINVLAVIYLLFFKFINSKVLLNEYVTVSSSSSNSKVSGSLPLKAQIIKKDNEWYICKLISDVEIDQSEFNYIKFKLKKRGNFKLQKENQLCLLKLTSSVHGHEISDIGFVK